jgi:plastocyanin
VEGPEVTLVEIDVTGGNTFNPDDVTIAPGTTVRWVLTGGIHTVTPDGHTEWTERTLDSAGETFDHRFDETGDFPYFCELHPGMTGTIAVE